MNILALGYNIVPCAYTCDLSEELSISRSLLPGPVWRLVGLCSSEVDQASMYYLNECYFFVVVSYLPDRSNQI